VARAAYAVQRGFVAPDRIVLLAFNKAAADELRERLRERFAAAGIDSAGVRVATFHSFGLDVIGTATGRKPRVASWLADRDGAGEVLRIVDALSDASPGFRYDWDLYRLLFSAASTELGAGEPDGWDSATSTAGFRTFRGEVVKSHGERLIADFLFLSGVDYRYEHPYGVDVADATHSQYRPDFYYPDVDVWHEHWAIGPDGSPPVDFDGYAESMAWKCQQHALHGTRLIETTFHEVVNGDGLSDLRAELEAHGVVFDWNPDRPLNQWVRPMDHTAMARLVRTFMAHVKSNSLTPAAMDERLRATPQSSGFRTELFLRIYWQIHHEWQRRLAADEAVDFEDMLNAATDRVEAGYDPGFDLVMVDEFQDASQARARLTRALVSRPGRFLFAVGDDWQAINRFAGSDLSVMTRFHDWFGNGVQLALTTTFRCPQRICDVASRFVSANPAQLSKPMRSAGGRLGVPVRVLLDDDPGRAVAACLKRLSAAVLSGSVEPGRDGRVTVDVLGRYGFQRELVGPAPAILDVRFRTVHSSKGLEADHVIVVGLDTSRHGFPSRIADDPVLDLAMPNPESLPHAEERRLFYVALTRARRDVTVIAPSQQMSPFVVELLADPDVVTETTDGASTAPPTPCPRCHTGTMTARSGPHGSFLGCTNFPACRQTQPHA
ncbi:MAG: UvrD-helicase domain-containing protein, partial [Actinobacteria bacterium]|nr:UvrD-helicase domain-containing protein [Actinomycetota bacterium]